MWMTVVYVAVTMLLILGLLGSVLPFMPGTLLILAGAFIYALATDFATLGTSRLLILAALTALAYGVDYVAGAFGVKRLGGSRWAMLGAVAGSVIGIFFGPVGLILGSITGAVVVELVRTREVEASLRSGFGSVLGMIVGTAAKLSLAVIMVGLFSWWTWLR
jgi:uncharacterized protein YqgC (DUF456 family)